MIEMIKLIDGFNPKTIGRRHYKSNAKKIFMLQRAVNI
jgi:hypothetical protein